jgi:hypothetical protein
LFFALPTRSTYFDRQHCFESSFAAVALYLVGRDLIKLLDPFAFLLLFLLLLGAANGLTNEGTGVTYIRHGFQYSFLLAFYLFGRSIAPDGLSLKQLKIIGAFIVLAHISPRFRISHMTQH